MSASIGDSLLCKKMWSLNLMVCCFVGFVAATYELDAEILKRSSYGRTCRSSNCIKAISSDRNGKRECSAFLLITVTPCPATSTTTTQCTATVPVATQTTTVTVVETKVSTVESTYTVDETPSPVTITETTVTTISETLFRRNARPTKCPTISIPTKIPTRFCKSCPKVYDFATACACLGVRPSTTTLKPKTTTITTGSCTTITPATVVTDSTTETETSTTQVTVTVTSTLVAKTETVVETSATTLFPPAPTTRTCFRLRVPTEFGAITSEINQRDPLVFDREAVSYSFGSQNPTVYGTISTIQGYYLYAAPPRTDTGGGNLDGVRLTSNRDLAENFQCAFIDNRLRCRSTRNGIKTQLLRCNFRAGTPADNTEFFIGEPGANGNCRPIEIVPVIRPDNTCA